MISSDDRFVKVFEEGPIGMALVTPTNRFHRVNQVLCQMLGYEKAELEGLTFIDITVPEDLEIDLPLARKLFAGEIPRYRIDKRYIRKDGRTIWITLSVSVLLDHEGNVEYALAMIEEIDSRKQMEHQLVTAQKLAEMTGRVAAVGGWEVDLASGKCIWSPEVFRIYGLPEVREAPDPEEAMTYYAQHSQEEVRKAFKECAESGTPFDLELELLNAEAKPVWVRARGEAELGPEGKPVRVVGTFQDISTQHRVRRRMQEANRRMELVLAGGNIGTWDWFIPEDSVRFDRHWAEKLGFRDGARSQSLSAWQNRIPQEDWSKIEPALNAVISGKEDRFEFEHRILTGSGDYIWVVSRGTVMQRDGDGRPVLVAGTHFDITERRQNEEDLRQAHESLKQVNADLETAIEHSQSLAEEAREAEHAKGEFLAVMSHEIRTPLNAILGMSSLLASTELTDEQREYADTIRESGEGLTSLISDILDYSKLDAGALELELVSTNLVELAGETLNLVAERAEEKNLEIANTISPGIPLFVFADPHRLRQALLNLLSNAVKFTLQGRMHLHLELVSEDEKNIRVQISVHDTGIGISPANQERLFNPFSQADLSITRKFGGTGLGLVIARKIVDRMGGSISVQSVEDVGSAFSIEIELEKDNRTQPLLEGTIMVVSPREAVRQTIIAQAGFLGLHCIEAESVEQGLTTLETGDPVLTAVLLDHTFGEQCESFLDTGGTPIVLITPLDRAKQRCSSRSFHGRLSYPPRPSSLRLALRRAQDPHAGPRVSQLIKRPRFDRQAAERNPLSILIVEDNATNRRVIRLLLSKLGYTPHEATNGREAVRAWEQEHYDLILMDVHMPEMDGIAATVQIRKHESHHGSRRTRIYALTADARAENVRETVSAGMDGHISKPLNPGQLESILQSVNRGAGEDD